MSSEPVGVRLGLLAYWQWLGWPRALVARLPGLTGIAGDGHFLLTVPLVALLAPATVVVAAMAVGLAGAGYQVVYTESVLFVAVAVGMGAVSTQLGALGVAAFAVGDMVRELRSGTPGTAASVGDVVHGWLPLLITYLLLFAVVVVLPRSVRAVVASVGVRRRIPLGLAWPLAGALVVLLTWLAVTAWVAAAPTLIRPVFTWTGTNPTVEAVVTLQVSGNRVVAAAIVGAIVRHLWIGLTVVPGPWRLRLRAAEALLQVPLPARGRGQQIATAAPPRSTAMPSAPARLAVDALAAALATLALSGVLLAAWVWIACFVIFMAVRILRRDTATWPWLQWWKRTTSRAPAWLRLLALFLFSRLTVDAASTTLITSYTQLALFVLLGVVLAFAVFPGRPAAPPAPGPAPGPGPGAVAGPAAASLAIAALAYYAAWQWWTTPPAMADNCSVFTDCFSQANTATETALGLGLLAILSLVLDFVPVVGTVKGVAESITGRDLLTGEELADWERVLGIVPFGRIGKLVGLAGDVSGAGRHVDGVVGAVRHVDDAAGAGRHVDEVAGAGRHADEAAGTGRGADGAKTPDAAGGGRQPPPPPPPPAAGGHSGVPDEPPHRGHSPLGDSDAVPFRERSADVESRVEPRLGDLSEAERARFDDLARDTDRGGRDRTTELEALDAMDLERAQALPGPVRRADPVAEAGADFVDASGQKWDHKQAWSGTDFDAQRYLDKIQKDLDEGENIILNHERLNQNDFESLVRMVHEQGLLDRFVFYPPL